MIRTSLFVLAAVLIAALSWMLLQAPSEVPAAVTVTAPPEADLASPESMVALSPAEEETARAASAPIISSVDAEKVPGLRTDEKVGPRLAHVVGRLLLPGGAPAAGAALSLGGWGRNDAALRKHGTPEDWKDVTGTTDASGRFDLELDPPLAYQFTLDASLPGYAELSWRWGSLPVGETTDVGEQTLSAAATIVGRVTDAAGESTGVRWRVYADSAGGARGADASNSRVSEWADDKTGEFRLEGVAPGAVELKAHCREANWIDGPIVSVEAGEEKSANIVYDGPALANRITVTTFSRPFFTFNDVEPGELTARDASGKVYAGEKIAGSSQSYAVNDLPPGTYSLEIETQFHRPWSTSGVKLGDTVRANLVGSCGLVLDVTDAETSKHIEAYGVRIRFHEADFSPAVADLHSEGKELPPGGAFEGLVPVPCTVVVTAEGYAAASVVLETLDPGERREVALALSRGATVRGRVTDAAGNAVPAVKVLLHPHFPSYDPTDIFSGPPTSGAKDAFKDAMRETQTDAGGAFVFESLSAGKFDVQCTVGQLKARQDGIELAGVAVEDLSLRLPAQGSLAGKVVGLRNAPPQDLLVIAYPAGARPRPFANTELATSPLSLDGAFRIERLVHGSYSVALFLPSRNVKTSHSSSMGTAPAYVEIGSAEVNGDVSGVTFDAAEAEPGTLTVRVSVNDAPAASVRVDARTPRPTDATQVPKAMFHTAGLTDEQGDALLTPIFPGTYEIRGAPMDRSWNETLDQTVTVDAGKDAVADLRVLLAAGRIQIIDAVTLEPASMKEITIDRRLALTTDAEGYVEVTLSAGSHQIRSAADRRAEPSEFSWSPSPPETVTVQVTF